VRKHPIDLFSLISGLLFTGFAVAYIVGAYTDVRLDARLALPLVLVGLGLAGLAGAMVAQRRSDQRLGAVTDGSDSPGAE
jgi:cytochrome c oxidase subunit IV